MQPDSGSFGLRLAALRTSAGLSQRQLAKQIQLSQRMVAYYEGRDALPPGHVLAALADVLGTSVDELVGHKAPRAVPARARSNQRLWRRFQQIEKLPPKDKRELFSVIEAFLDRHRLQKAS